MAGHDATLRALQPDEPANGRPSPIDWAGLFATPPQPPDYLARPIVARGHLVAIYSLAGVGKSLLALEMSAALAAGIGFLGQRSREPLSVVYVDMENSPEADVLPRLRSMGYAPHQLRNLHYYSFPALDPMDTPSGGRQLLALAQQHQADVVVIDTVSRTIKGDENESSSWLAWYRCTGMLLKREGIACVRLDHAGKDLEKGQRGSSAKLSDVDAVWQLTRTSGGRYRIKNEKSRQPLDVADQDFVVDRLTDPLRTARSGFSPAEQEQTRIQRLVTLLDDAGVPSDAGRPACRDALAVAGESAPNDLLSKVVSCRKNCPSPPRTAQTPQAVQPPNGQHTP